MQIVSACLARDLPIYRLTFMSLQEHLPGSEIHVITRKQDFDLFRNACGESLHLWDEAEMIPGMTLADLRQMPFSFFPKGAGWYFQQFLKYAFVDVSNDDDYFLIWDADTILLRPIEFFTPEGSPIYTEADENHRPYFETFHALFDVEAKRDFSFISQHQIIHKSTLRTMLSEIDKIKSTKDGWAWTIMENLRGNGCNLFSEYETYGHYLKLKNPQPLATRTIPWTRNGTQIAGYPPSPSKLKRLSTEFIFAAFEANQSTSRRLLRKVRNLFRIN
jgi:Family of unknown function (DUF6492)